MVDDGTEMMIRSSSGIKRNKTLLVRGSSVNSKETEFDWRERLRQWKKVSQSSGAVLT